MVLQEASPRLHATGFTLVAEMSERREYEGIALWEI
jgi:hypothetical protein